MKFLVDMPVSPKVCTFLKSCGHDAVHIFEIDMFSPDEKIFKLAQKEDRIILSMDMDFSTILFLSKANSPGVILFRMRFPTVENICERIKKLLEQFKEKELACSIVVVQDDRVRLRHLPL